MTMAEDPYLNCPFDVVHRIRKSRMQFHLVKCSKNHKLNGKIICPYNPLHIVENIEFMAHCQDCEDNVSVQAQQLNYEGEKCFTGDVSFETLKQQLDKVIPDNNEWDDCVSNTAGYDPKASIVTKNVFRTMMCEPKAVRKAFRREEQVRRNALEENTGSDRVSEPPAHIKPRPASPATQRRPKPRALQEEEEEEKKKKKKASTDNETSSNTGDSNGITDNPSEEGAASNDVTTVSQEELLDQLAQLELNEQKILRQKNLLLRQMASKAGSLAINEAVFDHDVKSVDKAVPSVENVRTPRPNPKCAANFGPPPAAATPGSNAWPTLNEGLSTAEIQFGMRKPRSKINK